MRKITSFGFRHEGGGPNAGVPGRLIVDVRKMFRNPFHDRRLRDRNGLDPDVAEDIRQTPRFDILYEHLKQRVSAPGVEDVWIGCTGGHHRSVYIAQLLADELGVPVEHRDLNKP